MPKRPTPYRNRIIEYCASHGIAVPKNFDASKSAEKYVLVDLSSDPPTLGARSTCFEKTLMGWASSATSQGRRVRLLDFKRQCELLIGDGGKLTRGGSIDALSAAERIADQREL